MNGGMEQKHPGRSSRDGKGSAAPIPAQPRGQTGKKFRRGSKDPWWLVKLKENPYGIASMAVLVLGGLMLMMFFGHVGAMPNLDLAGAASILSAVAMMGGMFGVSMVLPSFVVPALLAVFVRDYDVKNDKCAFWFLVVSVVAFVFVAFVFIDSFSGDRIGGVLFSEKCAWSIFCVVFLVWVLGAFWVFSKIDDGSKTGNGRVKFYYTVLSRIVVCFCFVFVWVISLAYPYANLADFSMVRFSNEWMEFSYAAAWIFLCIVVGVFVFRIFLLESVSAVFLLSSVVVIAFLLVFSVFTGNGAVIPRVAVSVLGLGEVPVSVVMSENGCASMNAHSGGEEVCRFDEKRKVGLVCPVFLKSRIGSPFFFELTSFRQKGGWPVMPTAQFGAHEDATASDSGETLTPLRRDRIAIPEKDVLSWHVIERLGKIPDPDKNEGDPASATQAASESKDKPDGAVADKAHQSVPGPDAGKTPEKSAPLWIRHIVTYLSQESHGVEGWDRLSTDDRRVVEAQRRWLRRVCGPAPFQAAALAGQTQGRAGKRVEPAQH